MKVRCTACQSRLVKRTKNRWYCAQKYSCESANGKVGYAAMKCTNCGSAVYNSHIGGFICANEKCDRYFFVAPDEEFIYAKKYKLPFSTGDVECQILGGYKYASISYGGESIEGKTHITCGNKQPGSGQQSIQIPFVKLLLGDSFNAEFDKLRHRIEKLLLLQ